MIVHLKITNNWLDKMKQDKILWNKDTTKKLSMSRLKVNRTLLWKACIRIMYSNTLLKYWINYKKVIAAPRRITIGLSLIKTLINCRQLALILRLSSRLSAMLRYQLIISNQWKGCKRKESQRWLPNVFTQINLITQEDFVAIAILLNIT
jgi:hypothetical protein